MSIHDKTIQTRADGTQYIIIYRRRKEVIVDRAPKSDRDTCQCEFYPVMHQGHGNWNAGCLKCGSLAR